MVLKHILQVQVSDTTKTIVVMLLSTKNYWLSLILGATTSV